MSGAELTNLYMFHSVRTQQSYFWFWLKVQIIQNLGNIAILKNSRLLTFHVSADMGSDI
jgi:hypothetical protein